MNPIAGQSSIVDREAVEQVRAELPGGGGNRTASEPAHPCDGRLWRTYFLFNMGAVQGKTIHTVKFNVFETWAASCTAKPADLYVTGLASSSTDWSHQPSATLLQEKTFAHGWSSNCAGNWEVFDVSNQLDSVVAGHNPTTLMLRGAGREALLRRPCGGQDR
jgi:hypothetical protein